MGPSGLIAILAGWYTTEIGRQPWVVYGVMRTRDAVSNHSALALSTTLIVIIVMYFAVFGTGISYMLKLVAKGPQEHGPGGCTRVKAMRRTGGRRARFRLRRTRSTRALGETPLGRK